MATISARRAQTTPASSTRCGRNDHGATSKSTRAVPDVWKLLCGMVRLAGEGLRSVGATPLSALSCPSLAVGGPGKSSVGHNPGPRLAATVVVHVGWPHPAALPLLRAL